LDLYLSIIKLFLKKEQYEAYRGFVNTEFLRANFPELLKVYHSLGPLHALGIENPSVGDLEATLYANYPKADPEIFSPLLQRISEVQADAKAIQQYLCVLEQRTLASELAYASLDFAEGRKTYEVVQQLTERLLKASVDVNLEKNIEDYFEDDDIDKIYNNAVASPGLQWRLASLRRSLGPLRRGDFGFIFARPETGKTTFLASEVTWMAMQADRPILWVNNEEQNDKVLMRCYEASLGAPLEKIISNREKARGVYNERTGRRIKVVRPDVAADRKGIEFLCRALKPALIVVDQLDKVRGFAADREDLLLGAIYQWARELAKEFAPVIGVSQADGSGEGVKYLNMGNVANAKTAKQAEADWILGIGVTYDDHPNIRGFSICKNKLVGGEETVPSKRHAKWDVILEAEIGRYTDTK
jgi:replicative DNA helicase